MATNIERGRGDLIAWEAAKPANYFEADANIQSVLRMHLGDETYDQARGRLAQAGHVSASQLDALVRLSNRDENLPLLQRYDGLGTRREEIVFHPSYHQLGRLVWATEVLAVQRETGQDLLAGALAYLIAHHGEGGHACPIACTSGLIKLLQQVGSREQQQRYLPPLLDPDYDRRLHASQFVTEVQGGSDVGANACVATPAKDRPGWFRISGEKWFCSVIDAGVFVVSARPEGAPEGTKGLALFIVPREIDGTPNAFTVRRLKYKLGTRSMASAEIDLDGALGEPVGPLDRGFKNLVGVVLDTSRVQNALAACGTMRRACIEAQTFAAHRRAFGPAILAHPMVQQVVARMRVETSAAIATTFRILAMSDRLARGDASGDLARARRVHVNINKYATALAATRVVRDGIEVLGGNGTIEDFSVLPRLYRDAIVIESWEGTHNTLCAQVLRDFASRGLHRPWLAELRSTLAGLEEGRVDEQRAVAETLLADLTERIGRLLAGDASQASLHVRAVVDRMCKLNSYVSLLCELAWERSQPQPASTDKEDLLELYRLLFLECADVQDVPELGPLFARVSQRI